MPLTGGRRTAHDGSVENGQVIEVARKRRHELHGAMVAMELALSKPSADPSWSAMMRAAAARLRAALADHVSDTEGTAGIIDAMREQAPRLEARLSALETEHVDLASAADDLAGLADRNGGAALLRVHALELLGALSRHRQRGADLVYDAFDIDIGGQS